MLIATALLALQASVAMAALVPDRRMAAEDVGVLFNWQKYKDFHGNLLTSPLYCVAGGLIA